MDVAEIKNLRKQHKYEEAYRLSSQDLKANPDDIWIKRNHAWSLYYMVKKHVQAGEGAKANRFMAEFEGLALPSTEKLVHERISYFRDVLSGNYFRSKQLIKEGRFEEAFDLHVSGGDISPEALAWALYYLVRSFNKTRKPGWPSLHKRLVFFKQHGQPEPKLVYKLLLQELIKTPPDLWHEEKLSAYLEFLGLFGILDEDDYVKQEYEEKKIISLAERLHIAYSKALIRENADKSKIQGYLKQVVEAKLEAHKEMVYVPYFKAKLLLATGDREEGMKAFLPFARKKQGEFWVWQVFAEYHQEDPDMYLSCLCKALTCRTKPEFLSGIRERLIAHLVAVGDFGWAKSELLALVQLREKQGWGLRSLHKEYLNSTWFRQATEIPLKGKYQQYTKAANDLLGSVKSAKRDVPVVVAHVNREKQVFNFITKEKQQGFGQYLEAPEPGGLYLLTGQRREGGFWKVEKLVDIESSATAGMDHLRKEVSGSFKQPKGKAFGFVQGVFLTPGQVAAYRMKNGDQVKGLAVFAPVKGKDEWAWKLVKVFGVH